MTQFYICSIGDSLTDANGAYGLTPTEYRTYLLKVMIDNAYGTDILVRSYGVAGQTTCQILARAPLQFAFKQVPDLIDLYAGANDPLYATTVSGAGATTTTIPVAVPAVPGGGAAAGDGLVGAYVLINGQSRKVLSVTAGAIKLDAALPAAPAGGTPVTIDTKTNLMEIVRAGRALGCGRFLLHQMHMKNWSAGGDTLTTEEPAYAGIRVQQLAAFNALDAQGHDIVFVQNLLKMRALVIAGKATLGAGAEWSTYDGNQHLNCSRMRGDGQPGGQDILAANALDAISSRIDWVQSIKDTVAY